MVGDSPDAGRGGGDGFQGGVPGEAVGHGVAGGLLEVAGVVGVAGREGEGDAGLVEARGVLQGRAQALEAVGPVLHRIDEHRHLRRGDLARHLPPFGGAGEDQLELPLPAEAQDGLDVARPVHGHDEGELSPDHRQQGLQVEPGEGVGAPVAGVVGLAVGGVVEGILEGLLEAEQGGGPRAAGEVGALLAEHREHGGRRAHQEIAGSSQGNDGALARDEALARAGRHHGAGQPLDAVDRDEDRARVEGVGDAEGRGDAVVLHAGVPGACHGADLDDAERRERVEEAGSDDLAAGVDPPGAGGHGDGGADRADAAVLDHQRAVLDRPLGTGRVDRSAGDGHDLGTGRADGQDERGEKNEEEQAAHHCTSPRSPLSRRPRSKSVSGWRAGSLRS